MKRINEEKTRKNVNSGPQYRFPDLKTCHLNSNNFNQSFDKVGGYRRISWACFWSVFIWINKKKDGIIM